MPGVYVQFALQSGETAGDSSSCGVEPHGRVERAAHQRHVATEGRVRIGFAARLRGRLLDRGHFRRPFPLAIVLGTGY